MSKKVVSKSLDTQTTPGARKRLTLDMTPATHTQLKKLAADKGVSMRDFIMQSLRDKTGIRGD